MGHDLHVEVIGSGPPLLVCHGGPGLNHLPYRTLDQLADRWTLVHWDHRGHGRSGPLPDGPVDMSLFADDAIAVADDLGLDQFALFGHSMGGWIAQELVLRAPDRATALILAATTPGQLGATESPDDEQGAPPPDEVLELLRGVPEDDAAVVRQYTGLAPYLCRAADPTPLIDALTEDLVSADSMVRVFGALERWSSVDRLATISCPTLVLAGQHDIFCSPAQLRRIATRIPGAEHVLFDDAGHFIWYEDPDGFFSIVGAFLEAHAAPG